MLARSSRLLVRHACAATPPPSVLRRCPCGAGSLSGAVRWSSQEAASSQVAVARLRSPVTWLSASATLAALYGLYEYQKVRQMTAQRVAGKPDLGGPFSLVDWDGKRVTSDDLKGKWTLLYFGFTKCPDICPEELTKVSGVLKQLDERQQVIQPVFITIDPSRDTTKRLKDYFGEAMMHPRFVALTGTHDEVRTACRAYRVYFTKPTPEEIKRGDYLLDHSIISYLVRQPPAAHTRGHARRTHMTRAHIQHLVAAAAPRADHPGALVHYAVTGRPGWRVCRLLWQEPLSRRDARPCLRPDHWLGEAAMVG